MSLDIRISKGPADRFLNRRWAKVFFAFLFIGVIALGGYLRFYNLNRLSQWQDEIHTVIYVNDYPSLWRVIYRVATWDLHSPLYYILLWMQVRVQQAVGIPLVDGNLRILSALLGTFSLLAVFLLFYRLYKNKWLALLSMAVAAESIYNVYYSQEIRMYSLIVLLAPLILYFRLGWSEAKDRGEARVQMAGYVLASVGLLYSSLVGVFFVFGVWLSLLIEAWHFRKEPNNRLREALKIGAVICICYLPWVGVMWRQSMELKSGVATGLSIPNPRELLKFAYENLWCHIWKFTSWYEGFNKVMRLLMPLVLLNWMAKERRTNHVIIWLCLGLTFTVYYVITFGKQFHTGRYFSPWWPFAIYFLVGIITGVEALFRRWPQWRYGVTLVTALGVLGGYTWIQTAQLQYYFTKYVKEEWREIAPYLNTRRQPEDALLVLGKWERETLEYYHTEGPFVFPEQLVRGELPAGCRRLNYVGAENPEKETKGQVKGFSQVKWPFTKNCYTLVIAEKK